MNILFKFIKNVHIVKDNIKRKYWWVENYFGHRFLILSDWNIENIEVGSIKPEGSVSCDGRNYTIYPSIDENIPDRTLIVRDFEYIKTKDGNTYTIAKRVMAARITARTYLKKLEVSSISNKERTTLALLTHLSDMVEVSLDGKFYLFYHNDVETLLKHIENK